MCRAFEQRRRDSRDTTRKHSGLHPAPDAVELDTTSMSLDEVVSWVVEQARERGIS